MSHWYLWVGTARGLWGGFQGRVVCGLRRRVVKLLIRFRLLDVRWLGRRVRDYRLVTREERRRGAGTVRWLEKTV